MTARYRERVRTPAEGFSMSPRHPAPIPATLSRVIDLRLIMHTDEPVDRLRIDRVEILLPQDITADAAKLVTEVARRLSQDVIDQGDVVFGTGLVVVIEAGESL